MLMKLVTSLGWRRRGEKRLADEPKREKHEAWPIPEETQDPEEGQLRYPAFPTSIPLKDIDFLLASQRETLEAIKMAMGLSGGHNLEGVELRITEPVRHLAKLVHLLPASDEGFFEALGGLFKFGLECGLHAYRLAESRMLTRSTPETRREEEKLWGHAAFLAGLYSEAVRVLSRISVYAVSAGNTREGEQWHPGSEPLYDWLSQAGAPAYLFAWHEERDIHMASAVVRTILPDRQAKYLSAGEQAILSSLMSALARLEDMANPLVRIVLTERGRLIERDQAANPTQYGKPYLGLHMEPWLIDSMRHLLLSRKWRVNAERGRVWVGTEGVFLVWPGAGHDIQKDLRDSKSPFIPRNLSTLADILLRAKVIVGSKSGSIHAIAVPQAKSAVRLNQEALLLSHPEILFEGATPESLGFPLLVQDEEEDAGNAKEEQAMVTDYRTYGRSSVLAAAMAAAKDDKGDTAPMAGEDETLSPEDYYNSYPEEEFKYPGAARVPDKSAETPATRFHPEPQDDGQGGDGPASRPEDFPRQPQSMAEPDPVESPDTAPPWEAKPQTHRLPEPGKAASLLQRLTGPAHGKSAMGNEPAKPAGENAGAGMATPPSSSQPAHSQAEPQPDPQEKPKSQAPREPGNVADMLQGLLASNRVKPPREEEFSHPFGVGDPAAEAKARARLILERIKRDLDKEIIPHSEGVFRVDAKSLLKAKLNVEETVSALKEAGLIEPIDGFDMGLEMLEGNPNRFVLIRADLSKKR